jgi:predicted nucleic acid-binding protein
MRFSIAREDARVHALVVGLHRDGTPAAETWRRVGEAAEELGISRPSYHTIRELVRAEEVRRRARTATRRAALGVLSAAGSFRVVDLPIALDALELARAKERLVSDRHKPP